MHRIESTKRCSTRGLQPLFTATRAIWAEFLHSKTQQKPQRKNNTLFMFLLHWWNVAQEIIDIKVIFDSRNQFELISLLTGVHTNSFENKIFSSKPKETNRAVCGSADPWSKPLKENTQKAKCLKTAIFSSASTHPLEFCTQPDSC